MSVIINDYIATSNNSINENKYNTEKLRASKIHKLKQLLKPVLAILKKRSTRKPNTYRKSIEEPVPSEIFYDSAYESDQNDANERLEQRLMADIDNCEEGAAMAVYNEHQQLDIVPVHRGQQYYIPVHFAKTAAGTFFWTTMSSADSDICCHGDKFAFSSGQYPEEQVPCDRWAQA